ncbi:MAG TPA: hypothetical protein VGP06_02590 [Janthinobacterium sp.]|jgi:hypothetical protein|nr:hypothetical protein [Janthinobacterium sp.]
MSSMKNIFCACLLAGSALGGNAAAAQGAGADWGTPASDAALDQARGGVDLGGGLVMSLGIARTVTINGNVLSTNTLNIADVARLNSEQGGYDKHALNTLTLLQNGAGNTFLAGTMPQAVAGTVVQNSLNDQTLLTRTVINSSVNSMELLKGINFQGSLRDALSGAIGIR